MSEKERRRLMVFDRVKHKQLNLMECSKKLGISYRQTLRSYKRYCEQGTVGLVHRSRGKPSNRAKPAQFKNKVIELYTSQYKGYGPTLAAEKLAGDGLFLDHETLRRWLVAEGKWNNKRGLKSGKLLWDNKRRAQITFSGSAPSQIKLYCYFNLFLL